MVKMTTVVQWEVCTANLTFLKLSVNWFKGEINDFEYFSIDLVILLKRLLLSVTILGSYETVESYSTKRYLRSKNSCLIPAMGTI